MSGQDIKFNFKVKINEFLSSLSVCLMFKSPTGEIVTSTPLKDVSTFLNTNQKDYFISFSVLLEKTPFRAGEYEMYFWLGESNETFFDLVDSVLPPLQISTDKEEEELGYNPAAPYGFFDIATQIIS